MIERVESLTGYNVSIGSVSGFTGFARMMTGTPLVSVPSEMIAMEMFRDECSGLVDMIGTAVNIEIKEFHQSLEPNIRQMTPESIFKPNAALNAAFTLFWLKIVGSEDTLLPFIAADTFQNGKELLKIFEDLSGISAEKYTQSLPVQ